VEQASSLFLLDKKFSTNRLEALKRVEVTSGTQTDALMVDSAPTYRAFHGITIYKIYTSIFIFQSNKECMTDNQTIEAVPFSPSKTHGKYMVM
jgi:hypothetical protein